MHCPYCGNALPDNAAFCSNCGKPVVAQATAQTTDPYANSNASFSQQRPDSDQYWQQPQTPYGYAQQPGTTVPANSKSKVAAGLLGIFLGSLGIHKFYLGYTKAGVITLLVSLLTLGIGAVVMEIIGIIEGIIYLTKSDEDFYNTYVVGEKQWF